MYQKSTILLALLFMANLFTVQAQDKSTINKENKGKSDIQALNIQPKGALEVIEGFEAWPPEGWAFYELKDACGFESSDEKPAAGLACAYHSSKDVDTDIEDWMVSPAISVPSLGQLTFKEKNGYFTDYVFHALYISTEGNDPTKHEFKLLQELNVGTYSWKDVFVDLSEYSGQEVYFGFKYMGDYASKWFIDELAMITPYDKDLTIEEFNRTSFAVNGKEANFEVIVRNNGQIDLDDQVLSIADGDFYFAENISLKVAETKTIQFSYTPAIGDHVVKAELKVEGDGFAEDNEVSYAFSAINIENPVYAYSMIGTSQNGNNARSIVMFDKTNPEIIQAANSKDQDEVYAMIYLDGFLYYMTVDKKIPKEFIKYNVETQESSVISSPDVRILNMAYNPADQKVYGYAGDMEAAEITIDFYTIDLQTGAFTKVSSVDNIPQILTFTIAKDNIAYATTIGESELYSINMTDFSFEKIGDTGLSVFYGQTAAWDFEKEELLWAPSYANEDGVYPVGLFKVDVNNGQASFIKDFDSEEQIVGMSFIYDHAVGFSDIHSEENTLEAYPNPVSTQLHLNHVFNAHINITDINGRVLMTLDSQQQAIQIDLTTLDNGIYLIQSICDDQVTVKKIILNK